MTDVPSPLSPFREAVLSVGTDLEPRTALQHIVDGAAELTGARYAALGTTDPGHDGLIEIRTPGTVAPSSGSLSVPIRLQNKVFAHLHLAGKRNNTPLALLRRRGDRPYTVVERLTTTRFASQAAPGPRPGGRPAQP
jgi:hypothetical protein